MSAQGVETAKLGRAVRKQLNGMENACDFKFFYDHGDRVTDPTDVAAIKAFCGDRVTNLSRLADIDLMVAAAGGEVKLLIEIEERSVSPKKLLGDVLAVLLCDGCAVKVGTTQRYYRITSTTRLIVAGVVPDSGNRLRKINEVVQPRLRQLTGFDGRLDPKNIELVFASSLDATIRQVENRVRECVCDH